MAVKKRKKASLKLKNKNEPSLKKSIIKAKKDALKYYQNSKKILLKKWVTYPNKKRLVLFISGLVILLLLTVIAVNQKKSPASKNGGFFDISALIRNLTRGSSSSSPGSSAQNYSKPAVLPENTYFGRVAFIVGKCRLLKAGSTDWKEQPAGQSLYRNESIKTEGYSEAEILMYDYGIIKCKDNTLFNIEKAPGRSGSSASVKLLNGKFYFDGKTRKTGLQAYTDAGFITAGNAQFTATYVNYKMTVVVVSGVVSVSAQGKTVRVLNNQATVVKLGEPPQEPFSMPQTPEPLRIKSH
jgi:hypothetical protein